MSRYRHRYVSASHPLATDAHSTGAHRLVLWDEIGPGPHACHWCGVELAWRPEPGERRLEVDHIDNDGLNNDPANLVPSCASCNVARGVSFAACRREGIEWTGSAEQTRLASRVAWAESAALPSPVYGRMT